MRRGIAENVKKKKKKKIQHFSWLEEEKTQLFLALVYTCNHLEATLELPHFYQIEINFVVSAV